MAVRTVVSKLVLVVALCPLLKSKSSFFDIEELQNLKYGVEITSEPVLLNQVYIYIYILINIVLRGIDVTYLPVQYPVPVACQEVK